MTLRFTRNERPARGCGRVAFFSAIVGVVLGCAGTKPPSPPAQGEALGQEEQSREPEVHEWRPPLQSAETCFNAVDDNDNRLIDEGCGVEQGQVQFVLAWSEPGADLDLYVVDPAGQVPPPDGVTDLGLAKSLDCPDEKSVCAGQNYENVYLEEDEIPRGKYVVRIRVEKIPEGRSRLDAQLSARLPNETIARRLSFFREEQEVLLEFSVAGPSKKE